MSQYPNLFKQPSSPGVTTNSTQTGGRPELPPLPALIPLQKQEEAFGESSVIDIALANKLGRDALLRAKAMEHTIKFLVGRTANKEIIGEIYDVIFEKLTHGTKQRPKIR